jgi:hypothetical protein
MGPLFRGEVTKCAIFIETLPGKGFGLLDGLFSLNLGRIAARIGSEKP